MANDESGSSGNTKHGPRTVAISASLITSLGRGTGDLVDRTWRAPTIHVQPERENNDRRPRQSLPIREGGRGGRDSFSLHSGQKLPLTKTLSWALERKKRLGGKDSTSVNQGLCIRCYVLSPRWTREVTRSKRCPLLGSRWQNSLNDVTAQTVNLSGKQCFGTARWPCFNQSFIGV